MRSNCALLKGEVLLAMLLTLILTVTPPLIAGTRSHDSDRQKPVERDQISARIEKVENGLLPPVVLKGEAPVPMRLSDRMKLYKTPGVSIAIINNGQIEWAKGYGVLENTGNQPVNEETFFQAASISKSLTALAALQLVEKKKLLLDEDVNLRLRSWKLPENQFTVAQKPTLRRLLVHNGGLSVPGFLGYHAGEPLPTLVQILDGQKPANSAPVRVEVEPGGQFKYSGGGYVVIQQLMTDITGQNFSDFMDRTLLKKLGMTHSTFQQPLSAPLMTNAAAGHLPDGKKMEGKGYVYPELAPAGLWTTPTDLARFIIEIQRARAGKSNKVISTGVVREMLTPQVENVGFGVFVEGQGASAQFNFGGSNVGFKSRFIGYTNSGQGAVVMTNSENAAPLINEILRSIAAQYGWPDYKVRERVVASINPSIYDAYVGEYEMAPGFILTVTREGEKLMSQASGQPKSELFPESETEFFVKDADATFKFIKDDKGEVVQVNIQRTTRMFRARRIRGK